MSKKHPVAAVLEDVIDKVMNPKRPKGMHQCKYCPEYFSAKKKMAAHMTAVHPNESTREGGLAENRHSLKKRTVPFPSAMPQQPLVIPKKVKVDHIPKTSTEKWKGMDLSSGFLSFASKPSQLKVTSSPSSAQLNDPKLLSTETSTTQNRLLGFQMKKNEKTFNSKKYTPVLPSGSQSSANSFSTKDLRTLNMKGLETLCLQLGADIADVRSWGRTDREHMIQTAATVSKKLDVKQSHSKLQTNTDAMDKNRSQILQSPVLSASSNPSIAANIAKDKNVGVLYTCTLCQKTLTSREGVSAHMQEAHPQELQLKMQQSRKIQNKLVHLPRKTPIQCLYCNKKLLQLSMTPHIKRFHPEMLNIPPPSRSSSASSFSAPSYSAPSAPSFPAPAITNTATTPAALAVTDDVETPVVSVVITNTVETSAAASAAPNTITTSAASTAPNANTSSNQTCQTCFVRCDMSTHVCPVVRSQSSANTASSSTLAPPPPSGGTLALELAINRDHIGSLKRPFFLSSSSSSDPSSDYPPPSSSHAKSDENESIKDAVE
jgi:hypothetical protein